MKKLFVFFTLFLTTLQASAMSYQDAMASSKPFVLYIYLNKCPACISFDKLYSKAKTQYAHKFNFVREEIETEPMRLLASTWKVNSFPFLAIINTQSNSGARVDYYCMVKQSCLYSKLDAF